MESGSNYYLKVFFFFKKYVNSWLAEKILQNFITMAIIHLY